MANVMLKFSHYTTLLTYIHDFFFPLNFKICMVHSNNNNLIMNLNLGQITSQLWGPGD